MNNLRKKHTNQLNHLKNIVAFRDLMQDSDVNIVYLGKITQTEQSEEPSSASP